MLAFADVLIISDLHLTPAHPKTAKRFMAFCEQQAREVKALFIIGDLFEFWVGDDVHLQDAFYQEVAHKIHTLVQSGVPVFFIAGNRDFIIGTEFHKRAGWQELSDPCLVEIGGQTWLLSHGDILCTADRPYQLLRWITRIPFMQWLYRQSPMSKRIQLSITLKLRAQKKYQQREQYVSGMDQKSNVTLQACGEVTKKFNCPRLIHGHTHLPDVHHEHLNGHEWTRWVLCDWDFDHPDMPNRANAFRINQKGLEIVDLSHL